MDAVTLVKLLFLSSVMVGLVRLFVIAFIGDAQTGPAIGRLIHTAKQPWRTS